jgi:hypothetical protein
MSLEAASATEANGSRTCTVVPSTVAGPAELAATLSPTPTMPAVPQLLTWVKPYHEACRSDPLPVFHGILRTRTPHSSVDASPVTPRVLQNTNGRPSFGLLR